MIVWCMAAAGGTLFEPVVTDLGGGARVNWSDARLEIEATSSRTGSEGTRAVEELARRAVDLRFTSAALDLPIAPDRTLRDLRKEPLWASLEPRIGRWTETENRYAASGEVAVVGALSLVELMKPVTMATASAHQGQPTARTGATLDARGHVVAPCFAPRIVDPAGVTVYDGRLWLDAAVEHPPAVWVSDAASPAAGRSGANPMLAEIARAEGCVITLDSGPAAELRELVEKGRMGEGTLVIVVDR
jgi:hypothetical protein